MSCPYGVIKPLKEDKKIAKCDLCPHLDTPACVSHCPTASLIHTDTEEGYLHEPTVADHVVDNDSLFTEG